MKIGIDLSVLQTGHRKRGVGSVLINFINNLPKTAKTSHEFIFYFYDNGDNPLDLLDLNGVNYETRHIKPIRKVNWKLPRRLGFIRKLTNELISARDIIFGDSRIKHLRDIGCLLQFDQNQSLPARWRVKSCLIVYDLIPYVMEADYLWSYSTARLHGRSRIKALARHFWRKYYIFKLRRITKKANWLISISEHTKNDFVKYIGVKPGKIKVCLLGVSKKYEQPAKDSLALHRYINTSWGPIEKPTKLNGKKFLLFIGGIDPRRRLTDLIAAFNNLRAQGEDIKLVLAGDTMYSPREVPNTTLQKYFSDTSYLDDIYFMGFVNNEVREWLYENALAFVYPSVYEGFGLPILEAMQYGTPVITYNNSSIPEVASDAAIYVNDYQDIYKESKYLLQDKSKQSKYYKRGRNQARQFSWSSTSEAVLKTIGA